MKEILGIDVGGSGIKGAIVNCREGKLSTERIRIPTPTPPSPENIAITIAELVSKFDYKGPVGVGFPAVVKNGTVYTAANIDSSFIGLNYELFLKKKVDRPIRLINDADAAGLAEIKFGAGKDNKGLIILVTIGTGIGSVIVNKGKLIYNTELGHIYLPGDREAEKYASDATRKSSNLEWSEWAKRINEYLMYLENLFWPDLFIVGGGISKHEDKFLSQLTLKTKTVTAQLLNNAGIIGAALSAKKLI
ncbi:MAG: ROK family protein [Bacteroidales bacterium]|nr:ROK family protein [Bacteroidales bacterium]